MTCVFNSRTKSRLGNHVGLFAKYTKRAELVRVKTSGMGSLYELHYRVALREPVIEKAFLDDLRCRNGNLTISCGPVSTVRDEL